MKTGYEDKYDFLEKTKLVPNNTEKRVALIKRIALRKAKNSEFYFSLMLKDRYGKTVYGCFFDIQASSVQQSEIDDLIGRVATVEYTTQLLKGRSSPSLDIISITPLPFKDQFEIEKYYFKDEYPNPLMDSSIKYLERQIDKITNRELREFIKRTSRVDEFRGCADTGVYDGMIGGPISVAVTVMAGVLSVAQTQPNWFNTADNDILIAMVAYCELLYATYKPLHDFGSMDFYKDMLGALSRDRKIVEQSITDESSGIFKAFFEECEEFIWSEAGVSVTISMRTQVYMNFRNCARRSHFIVNLTNEIPSDTVITYNQKNYKR